MEDLLSGVRDRMFLDVCDWLAGLCFRPLGFTLLSLLFVLLLFRAAYQKGTNQ